MYYLSLISITLMVLSFYVPAFFSLGLLLGGSSVLLAFTKFKVNTKALVLLLCFLLLLLPSCIYFSSSQYNLQSATVVTLGVLHGFSLSLNRELNNSFLSWLPLVIIILIVSAELISGASPRDIYPKNGGNYVSINLFGAYLSYFLLSKNFVIGKVHVVFTFLIMVLCIASQGRSGAALASLMFVSTFYYVSTNVSGRLSKTLKNIVRIGIICVLTFSLALAFFYAFKFYQEAGGLEKLLDRGFYNNPREYLISEYLKLMNFESVIFGLNVFEHYQLGLYGFNLHNNYLELHSKFGLFIVIFYLYTACKILLYFTKNKSYLLLIALLIFFIRAYTDIQVIVGRFDYVLFFLFFYFIVRSTKYTKHKNQQI